MLTTASALGDFLRARREQIRPEDVGLNSGPRRRVLGLRREELPMLAGISVDYYLRLEQGHDEHVSLQVLDALARALRLDVKATEHLHQLDTGEENPQQALPLACCHYRRSIDCLSDLEVPHVDGREDLVAINDRS